MDEEIEAVKQTITLPMLERIARNEMPACFEFTRATGVALAQIALEALRQNEEFLKLVPKH